MSYSGDEVILKEGRPQINMSDVCGKGKFEEKYV